MDLGRVYLGLRLLVVAVEVAPEVEERACCGLLLDLLDDWCRCLSEVLSLAFVSTFGLQLVVLVDQSIHMSFAYLRTCALALAFAADLLLAADVLLDVELRAGILDIAALRLVLDKLLLG